MAKRDQNRPKYDQIGYIGLNTIILYVTGWKKVGTVMRTFRDTSLGHFQDPECPKCGPSGPKSYQYRLNMEFWPHKLATWPILGLKGQTKVGL